MSNAAETAASGKVVDPLLRSEALYAPWVGKEFKRRRIVVVPQAVSTGACKAILRAVRPKKFITVDQPQAQEVTRFYTINGGTLLAACPEVAEIEHGLLEWISHISGTPYQPLDNRPIGISLNVTPPGGGFGTHRDRHAVTIILYLNDADGGALHIYSPFPTFFGRRLPTPLLASWLRRARRYAIKTLNMSRSRVAKALHQLVFHPVRADPRIGTVAALTSLSDHRVDPVAPGSLRFALVIAGDRPGVTFEEGQDYYGNAAAEVVLSEVIPAAQTAAPV